jgi:hypothetical protein
MVTKPLTLALAKAFLDEQGRSAAVMEKDFFTGYGLEKFRTGFACRG